MVVGSGVGVVVAGEVGNKTKLSPARASLLGLSLAKSPQHQHQSQIEYKSDMPTETCFLLDWYYINVSALPS